MSSKVNKIFKASFILLVVSWYSRVLSAISIVILARNLTKVDFGILAGCFVVQGFFNILANLGGQQYLIRKERVTQKDLDVSWTINFCSKLMIAVFIFLFSDYSAKFMNIPEMSLVLKAMSISAIFSGCANPAINLKVKRLEYGSISKLEVFAKSLSSTVSVTLAILYQSYWAVVIASLIYSFIYSFGSHLIAKTKLKFDFKGLNEQWQFSKWILLKGIVSYIKSSFDRVVIGKYFSVGDLGLYNFANESSSTALQFLISPINKLIYPSLSDYVNDNKILSDKMYKFILVLSCVYSPVVFGGVYLSNDLVPFIFGQQWVEAIPLFNLFLIMSYSRMLGGVLTDIFTLTGQVKKQFIYELFTSILFLVLIFLSSTFDIYTFTTVRIVFSYVSFLLLLILLSYVLNFSIYRLSMLVLPFLISSSLMIVGIMLIENLFDTDSMIFSLLIAIIFGAIFYSAISVLVVMMLRLKYSEFDFVYKTFFIPLYRLISKRVVVR